MTRQFEKMTDAHFPAGRPLSRRAGVRATVLVPFLTALLLPLAAQGADPTAPPAKAPAAAPAKVPTAAPTTAAANPADKPPAGRYRCYLPPRFTVVSWFDLEQDGTYRAQGAPATPYRYDAQHRQLRWLAGDHAERGWVGLYLPPAADGAGGIRHTIVMTSVSNLRPPTGARDPRPQCYLTTH